MESEKSEQKILGLVPLSGGTVIKNKKIFSRLPGYFISTQSTQPDDNHIRGKALFSMLFMTSSGYYMVIIFANRFPTK